MPRGNNPLSNGKTKTKMKEVPEIEIIGRRKHDTIRRLSFRYRRKERRKSLRHLSRIHSLAAIFDLDVDTAIKRDTGLIRVI
jgi:hypothetical protein